MSRYEVQQVLFEPTHFKPDEHASFATFEKRVQSSRLLTGAVITDLSGTILVSNPHTMQANNPLSKAIGEILRQYAMRNTTSRFLSSGEIILASLPAQSQHLEAGNLHILGVSAENQLMAAGLHFSHHEGNISVIVTETSGKQQLPFPKMEIRYGETTFVGSMLSNGEMPEKVTIHSALVDVPAPGSDTPNPKHVTFIAIPGLPSAACALKRMPDGSLAIEDLQAYDLFSPVVFGNRAEANSIATYYAHQFSTSWRKSKITDYGTV